jgi:histidyl-tRNA synthetase
MGPVSGLRIETSEIRRVRGTNDVVPPARALQRSIEDRLLALFTLYGYEPIDTPVLEPTELFLRKSGEEIAARMYSFTHWNRNLCLRPEFTASVIRAYVNQLQDRPLPVRLHYAGPTFRYEKPQRGRYRQFTEVGVECIGVGGAAADAEVLALARHGLDLLGLHNATFVVGHLGAVLELLTQLGMDAGAQSLVLGVMEHLSREPGEEQRVVARLAAQLGFGEDDDDPEASALADLFRTFGPEGAERIAGDLLDLANLRLDEGSRSPSDIVQRLLLKAYRPDLTPALARAIEFIGRLRDAAGPPAEALPALRALLHEYGLDDAPVQEVEQAITYFDAYFPSGSGVYVNLSLARGLRYYNGLVFEVYDDLDNQIAGGGRYDDLVRSLGGRAPTPACGFSYGLERVVAALQRADQSASAATPPTALIVPVASADYAVAASVASSLRVRGIPAEMDVRFRGVRAGLRHADRASIPFVILIGEQERTKNQALLRDMRASQETAVALEDLAATLAQRFADLGRNPASPLASDAIVASIGDAR